MGRRSIDRISQERLVYELRVAIDRCVRRPWDTQAQGALRRLLAANPRSARSSHVTYNLGRTRVAWLRQVVTTDARSVNGCVYNDIFGYLLRCPSCGEEAYGPIDHEYGCNDAGQYVPYKLAQEGEMVRENPELQKQARPPHLPEPLDIKEDRTPAQLRRDGDEPRVIKGDAAPTTKKGS